MKNLIHSLSVSSSEEEQRGHYLHSQSRYLWPNLYFQIKEDLIVRTPSRGSIVTGVTTSGTTTLVDPPTPPEELHEVPLPPALLPKLP